jgi:hypothetical protein
VDQALAYYVPLFAFMLIPVWIPIIAIVVGNVIDRVRPPEVSRAEVVVSSAKQRAVAVRGTARTPVSQPLAA